MVSDKGDSRLDGLRNKLKAVQGSKDHPGTGSVVSSTNSSWAQRVADTSGMTATSVCQTYTVRVANNQAGDNTQNSISGASRGLRPSAPIGPASSIGIGGLSMANRGPQWSAIKSVYGSTTGARSQASVVGMKNRPTDKFHHPEEYQEGVVFSAVTHEQHYRQTELDPRNPNHTEANFGIANSKFRKFIVLRRFEHHCIALPIKTHEGRGLLNKNAHGNEFVSIRDGNLRSSAAPAESSRGILWATLYPEFQYESPWHKMNDNCCLHITAPYSHNMQLKSSISGKLEPESMNKLRQLFREVVSGDKRTVIPRPAAMKLYDGVMGDDIRTPTGPRPQHRQSSNVGTASRQPNTWASIRSNIIPFSASAR